MKNYRIRLIRAKTCLAPHILPLLSLKTHATSPPHLFYMYNRQRLHVNKGVGNHMISIEICPVNQQLVTPDEVIFLQQPKISHPVLMKLYGYCCEDEQCGIVYDFKSFNTVSNLIDSDDFKWWQRVKVALRFAHFLKHLHVQTQDEKPPLIIRNIDAAHIMVDEDWNPKLYDFSMVTGSIFPDRTLYRVQHVRGCYGYKEPLGSWSQKSDVYGFGVVLLCMMSKKVYTDDDRLNDEPSVREMSFRKYREGGENIKMSLVHESFKADQSFCASDGPKITRLAISCASYMFDDRPEMKSVVDGLQKLEVVQRHLNAYVEK